VAGRSFPKISTARAAEALAPLWGPLGRAEGEDLYRLQSELRELMWRDVGLIRDAERLREALSTLEELGDRIGGARVPGGSAFNLAWQDWLNLRNQIAAARLIARSALERAESRGSHYRRDHPEPASEPLYTVRVRATGDGVEVWREPVRLTRATPERMPWPPLPVEIGD
jgi:fumarate reductase flavoprotein subunit